jgi:outer membrane protein assembly factor BamB
LKWLRKLPGNAPSPIDGRPMPMSNMQRQQSLQDQSAEIYPAVLNAAGSVVIARSAQSDGSVGLVALAGSDGQQLWSTFDDQTLSHLTFTPGMVTCGRFVYATAIDASGPQASFVLLALDVTSGREIWRSTLGLIFPEQPPGRVRGNHGGFAFVPTLPVPRSAGIAVAGDELILTPNVGWVIVVDRFSGRLRWLREYSAVAGGQPVEGRMLAPPRYDNRPFVAQGVVVIAPQDSNLVQGFDAASGEKIWENPNLPHSTLVGVSGAFAVLAGNNVDTLDIRSGQIHWHYFPAAGAKICGPPVVYDAFVYIPTTTDRVVMDVDKEQYVSNAPEWADIRDLLSDASVRQSLMQDHADASFMVPQGQ